MRRVCCLLIVSLLLLAGRPGIVRADEYHGINAGAPIWGGAISLTQAKAAAIAATGCRAVRVNFRLDGHVGWDSSILAQYDTVIQNAASNHLVVLGLLCNEAVAMGQQQWNDDADGDGMNPYVTQFSQAALLIVDRYKDRIKRWEIWNEPGAWTNPNWATDPQNAGGTYMLPRVYANLLAETYKQLNYYNGRTVLTANEIKLCSGGLFAHDIGGSFSTGMAYMLDVYDRTAVWNWMQANTGRRYPWDYFGYHFYLNGGEPVSTQEIGNYLNDVRAKQTSRGDTTPVLITEFGWTTAGPSETLQRNNMRDTYNYLETKSYVAGTYWYQWQDESANVKYGIVRADGSHKPSYDEFVLQNAVPPPVAGFTGAPASGDAPLVVQFTNASTGAIDTYAWTFGDGGTSAAASPSYTYASAGTYTVALTVTGPGGSNALTRTDYIQVTAPPQFAPGDIDRDGDVDQADFGLFQACFSGSGFDQDDPACAGARLDADSDVDQEDLTIFRKCMSGADTPASLDCIPA